jgi:hypothetical protein
MEVAMSNPKLFKVRIRENGMPGSIYVLAFEMSDATGVVAATFPKAHVLEALELEYSQFIDATVVPRSSYDSQKSINETVDEILQGTGR